MLHPATDTDMAPCTASHVEQLIDRVNKVAISNLQGESPGLHDLLKALD